MLTDCTTLDSKFLILASVLMKLLFLFDNYFPSIGGAEILYQKLAEYFAGENEVQVITSGRKTLPRQEITNRVKIHRTRKVARLFQSVSSYLAGKKVVKGNNVIISATYASGLSAFWLAKKYHKKSVLIVHEVLDQQWSDLKNFGFLYRWYERYIITRKFDQYIAVSEFTKKKLVECGIVENKISVIYNGVDQELFQPRPVDTALREKIAGKSPFVYLYFGRPGVSKGVLNLIRAVPEVKIKIPGSKLVLILAKEPHREYTRTHELIQQLHLQDTIVVLDPVEREKLPDYVNIADAVVVPSFSEGFGLSAIEACTLGKIVVANKMGALPEVAFGRVVWIELNHPKDIAVGLLKAYDRKIQTLSQKQFRWEKTYGSYATLLEGMDESVVKE